MSAGRPAGRFVLETERLLLREMGQSDLAALCAILQDDETMYAYEGALSDDEAQAWLDRQMERYARDGFGLWAVVLKETGAMTVNVGSPIRMQTACASWKWATCFGGRFGIAATRRRRRGCVEIMRSTRWASIQCIPLFATRTSLKGGAPQQCKPEGSFVKRYRDVDMPHIVYAVSRAVRDGVY